MPRTSRTSPADKPPDPKGLELAKHKQKLRNHRDEIVNLKRSGKVKDLRIERLQMALDYLTKCAEADKT